VIHTREVERLAHLTAYELNDTIRYPICSTAKYLTWQPPLPSFAVAALTPGGGCQVFLEDPELLPYVEFQGIR